MSDFQSDYKSELYVNPLFDYYTFYKDGKFTDYEIQIDEFSNPIRAHSVVLANSSIVLRNSMINGGTVYSIIERNDNMSSFTKYLPDVIGFMYNGSIKFQKEETMLMLHISSSFEIPSLFDRIKAYLTKNINDDTVLSFVNQCYKYGFKDELQKYLVPYLKEHYKSFTPDVLTESLDVETFCEILRVQPNEVLSPEDKLRDLNIFIGDFECDSDEKRACLRALKQTKEVKTLLKANKENYLRFLPENYKP